MSAPSLCFVGFGEAPRTFSAALRANGLTDIRAYVRSPRNAEGVTLSTDMADALKGADVVISAVTAGVALEVAKDVAPSLAPGQIYLDINSVAPGTKQEMAAIVNATGARFVEAALMGNVTKWGLSARLLLCGAAASDVIRLLSPYGMVFSDLGPDYGRAAASKMFRAIMTKGLEALLQECVRGAEHYGAGDEVLEQFGTAYPGIDWKGLADHFIPRTAVHGMRRAEELDEVAKTLRALGEEPIMAEASAKRLRTLASPDMKARFADAPAKDYHDVLAALKRS